MQPPQSISVIYHYFENNETYRDNLVYFLSTAILEDVDYTVIISGVCTVSLPEVVNIKYIHTQNKNNDYGGYVEYFKQSIREYDYYFFINSSTRGPFLPTYFIGNWLNPFLDKLKGNTHLVGGSINLLSEDSYFSKTLNNIKKYRPPYHHVQTTAFAMTNAAKNYLMKVGFFSNESTMTKEEVILSYEIGLSAEIIKNKWSISTILPIYRNFYGVENSEIPHNYSCKRGDMLQKNGFFSRTLTPFDLIFIKTNRDLLTDAELASYTYTGLLDCGLKCNQKDKEILIEKCKVKLQKYAKKYRLISRTRKFFGLK